MSNIEQGISNDEVYFFSMAVFMLAMKIEINSLFSSINGPSVVSHKYLYKSRLIEGRPWGWSSRPQLFLRCV